MASAAAAPIKIDMQTDELLTQAAHFLRSSKKDIVDAAVREYIEKHRAEIQKGVLDALRGLDGSTSGVVSLLSGLSKDELAELGGVPEGQ
jgi:predicted transcriptional regulator